MKLYKFQHLNNINNLCTDDTERVAFCVSYIFNKTEDEIETWSKEKFERYANKLAKLFEHKKPLFKHIQYMFFKCRLETNATKLTAGQFIECVKWLEDEHINNIHLLSATLLQKRKKDKNFNHKKESDRILNLKVNLLIEQIEQFKSSFETLLQKYKQLFDSKDNLTSSEIKMSNHPFMKMFGWQYSAKVAAEYLGIKVNDVYKTGVIEFLNTLLLLKMKGKFEYYQRKQTKPNE